MADETRSLLTRYGADSSEFDTVSKKVVKELEDLNTEFFKNQTAMKKVSQEYTNLAKDQKKLEAAIKSGTATKEETEQYEKNKIAIDKLILEKAKLKTTEQTLKAQISNTTAELKNQNTAMDNAKSKLGNLGTAIKLFAAGYTGKKLWDFFIASNAEMEQYETSFSVMLGGATQAKSMMKELTQFASVTPFTLQEVVPNAQLLLNYGVAAKDVIDTMTKLGDLAQGNNDKYNRIALAYGQMLAKGKVTGEELRQMTEAGVPLTKALQEVVVGNNKVIQTSQSDIDSLNKKIIENTQATKRANEELNYYQKKGNTEGYDKAIQKLTELKSSSQQLNAELSQTKKSMSEQGQSTADIYNAMQEAGKVSISDLNNAITSLTTGSGQFAGMMEKQSHTMNGLISTVKDNLQQLGRDVGEEAFDEIKSSIDDIMTTLQKAAADGSLAESAEKIGKLLVFVVTKLWELRKVIIASAAGMATFKASMAIGTTISSVVGAIRALSTANKEATATQAVLNNTMKANPYVMVISAVTSLLSVLGMLSFMNKDNASTEETQTDALEEQISTLEEAKDKYEELGKKTNKTASEKLELLDTQQKLSDSYGDEANGIDLVNGKYDEQIGKLDALKKAKLEELQNKQIVNTNKAEKNFENNESKSVTGYVTGTKPFSRDTFDGIDNLSFSGASGTKQGEVFLDFYFKGNAAERYKAISEALEKLKDVGITEGKVFNELTNKQTHYKNETDDIIKKLKAEISTSEELGENNERLAQNKAKLATYLELTGSATDETTKKTEDYKKALEILEQTEVSESSTAQEKEVQKSKALAVEIAHQIGMYQKEVASIKSVADANLVLAQMEEDRWNAAIKINSYLDAQAYNTKYGSGTNFDKLNQQVNTIKSLYQQITNVGKSSTSSSIGSSLTKEITAIEKYTAALKKLSDDRIAAIDKEIAARNKLKETATTQKEIDRLNALIKYQNGSQADDFSKKELINQRDKLLEQQKDAAWLDSMNTKKEQIQNATNYVSTALQGKQTPTAQSIVNNNSRSANVNLALAGMTSSQVSAVVRNQLRELLGI